MAPTRTVQPQATEAPRSPVSTEREASAYLNKAWVMDFEVRRSNYTTLDESELRLITQVALCSQMFELAGELKLEARRRRLEKPVAAL